MSWTSGGVLNAAVRRAEIKLDVIGGRRHGHVFFSRNRSPVECRPDDHDGGSDLREQAWRGGSFTEVVLRRSPDATPGRSPDHVLTGADRGGDGEAQSPRRVHHAARTGDRVRAGLQTILFCHGGCRGRTRGRSRRSARRRQKAMMWSRSRDFNMWSRDLVRRRRRDASAPAPVCRC